jgi:alpha-tubulin suppressor-like RCC1 family protein
MTRTAIATLLALVPACILPADDTDDGAANGTDSFTTDGVSTSSDGVDDATDPATSADAVTSVDTTDDADTTDPSDPSDPTDPSDTTDPTDATDTDDPTTGLPSAVAIDVAVGRQHSCAALDDGTARCWGYSDVGQLGHGAPLDDVPFREPVAVESITGIVAISAYGDHTCALDDGGTAWCWGANDHGQLGDGTTEPRATPSAVDGSFVAISAGYTHTCGITQSGAAMCWGHNDYGQLGDDSIDDRSTPVAVVGLGANVVAISAGRDHSCAVTDGGALSCWGGDTYGELGNGEPSSASHTPVAVDLGGDAVHVAAGDNHTCAIDSGGAALCWGKNGDGQLGNGGGGTLEQSNAPTDVVGIGAGATAISTGWGYTCAVVSGATRCWGDNFNLVLGNGEGAGFESHVPVDVTGLGSGSVDVVAAVSHTCARDDAGAVRCWGTNGAGALGDGSDLDADVPVAVIGLP